MTTEQYLKEERHIVNTTSRQRGHCQKTAQPLEETTGKITHTQVMRTYLVVPHSLPSPKSTKASSPPLLHIIPSTLLKACTPLLSYTNRRITSSKCSSTPSLTTISQSPPIVPKMCIYTKNIYACGHKNVYILSVPCASYLTSKGCTSSKREDINEPFKCHDCRAKNAEAVAQKKVDDLAAEMGNLGTEGGGHEDADMGGI